MCVSDGAICENQKAKSVYKISRWQIAAAAADLSFLRKSSFSLVLGGCAKEEFSKRLIVYSEIERIFCSSKHCITPLILCTRIKENATRAPIFIGQFAGSYPWSDKNSKKLIQKQIPTLSIPLSYRKISLTVTANTIVPRYQVVYKTRYSLELNYSRSICIIHEVCTTTTAAAAATSYCYRLSRGSFVRATSRDKTLKISARVLVRMCVCWSLYSISLYCALCSNRKRERSRMYV